MSAARDSYLDNIKILLLFMVAFAHNLIPFKDEGVGIEIVIKAIYCFHMPLFAFVTGYLVRKSKRDVWGYIKKLLAPYLVFQLLYIVIGAVMINMGVIDYSSDTMTLSIVEPSGPLYFLVCMMVWRLLCPVFDQIKRKKFLAMAGVILAAAMVCFDPYSNTMVMPIFSLLPFYYIGYVTEWAGGGKKLAGGAVSACIAAVVYFVSVVLAPYEIILFRMNVWDTSTDVRGGGTIWMKVLYILIAACGIAWFMAVVPRKSIKGITSRTKNGMIIYIGSSFMAPYLYIVLYNLIPALQKNLVLNVAGIIVFTIFVIWFCSWNCWMKLYNFVFERNKS